jgi:glycosyltransferase involved in cell wall biosynthesis
LLFGIKSFLKTDEGELQIYTRKTTDKADDYAEIVAVCDANTNRLKLFDNVPQRQLFESLKSAKGFIFPSKRESCGLVAFEAFSAGCPVVYSVPDSNFFLQDWDFNRLVSRRVVSDYANAIAGVNVTQTEKERMWQHVKTKWSADAFRNRLVTVLGLGVCELIS